MLHPQLRLSMSEIFSTHGFLKIIVSDNATIFSSTEFQECCRLNGILQNLTAPRHSAKNSLTERNDQIEE